MERNIQLMCVDSLLNLVMPIPGSPQRKLTDWSSEIMGGVSGGRGIGGSEPDWKILVSKESFLGQRMLLPRRGKGLESPYVTPKKTPKGSPAGPALALTIWLLLCKQPPSPPHLPGNIGILSLLLSEPVSGRSRVKEGMSAAILTTQPTLCRQYFSNHSLAVNTQDFLPVLTTVALVVMPLSGIARQRASCLRASERRGEDGCLPFSSQRGCGSQPPGHSGYHQAEQIIGGDLGMGLG